ncbi:hypothetical protein U0070_001632, partial [Myodes glareolus]
MNELLVSVLGAAKSIYSWDALFAQGGGTSLAAPNPTAGADSMVREQVHRLQTCWSINCGHCWYHCTAWPLGPQSMDRETLAHTKQNHQQKHRPKQFLSTAGSWHEQGLLGVTAGVLRLQKRSAKASLIPQ